MNRTDLEKMLQKFPPEAPITLVGTGPLSHVEMHFNADPVAMKADNLAWADMVKERIGIRLIGKDATLNSITASGSLREAGHKP